MCLFFGKYEDYDINKTLYQYGKGIKGIIDSTILIELEI